MWRVYRSSKRPWPAFSEDDVIDYMVMEAVSAKAAKAEADEIEAQKRKRWQEEQKERLKQTVS